MPTFRPRYHRSPLSIATMSRFADEYINCLKEAKKLGQCSGFKPTFLNNHFNVVDFYEKPLHIKTRYQHAKAYLEGLQPVIKLIEDDFKNQKQLEQASHDLFKTPKDRPMLFKSDVTFKDAKDFFRLISYAIKEMEKELDKLDMLEKPPLYGTPDYSTYIKMIHILEAASCLLAKPALFSQMRMCLCRRHMKRVRLHIGDLLHHDPGIKEPFLETFVWDIDHTYIEAHFKDEDEPFLFKMELDEKTGKLKPSSASADALSENSSDTDETDSNDSGLPSLD